VVSNLTDLVAMIPPALIITLTVVPRPLHIGALIANALPVSPTIGLGLGDSSRRRQGDAGDCDGRN
jgi:hypothetical protein